MDQTIRFQELFIGFQETPLLWNSSEVYDLKQFIPKHTSAKFSLSSRQQKLRLGKWVEKFLAFQIRQQKNLEILEENIIIKNNKQTIGELDVLLLKDEQPIHLEIIYKFYLYDPKKDAKNTLASWVGPNRNDALIYKLNKLKEKQLPLLYHSQTREILNQHHIDIQSIKQTICFKAQLFLPFNNQNIDVKPLSSDCIAGWYLNFNRIDELETFQFYIPEKLDWLLTPKASVNWLSFYDAKTQIKSYITNHRSPLCWVKKGTDSPQKCFITWW